MGKLVKEVEEYQLSDELGKILVTGIINGNRSYAIERTKKSKEMIVSSAYQWTRANHIDNAIYNEFEAESKTDQVGNKVATAGYTWDYVQFLFKNKNAVLIVKPGEFRDVKYGTAIDSKHQQQEYMKKLAKLNKNNFRNSDNDDNFTEQLVLFDSPTDIIKAEEHFDKKDLTDVDKFYILAYSLNHESEISAVKLFMPSPEDKKVVLIQDFSSFIGDAAALNDEQKSAVKHDQLAGKQGFYGVNSIEYEAKEYEGGK
ncbi:spr1630 family ClpXP-sensitive toxin [Pediococcus pentosaceus]|uniref:spr1630 family ClpXP-sensitive toxin n=1 Tax=Pediococcus pentosaceus TaxID=1255 RepID=UPI000258B8AC|nr:hypothetical protein [Pediococcus pentosaceus]CCG89843.1 hypothetical protein PCPN_427 [Pediococcus pentosaceus IE-3]